MASLTSCHGLVGKLSFLPRPPPPFDLDFVGEDRESDDMDDLWLPELTDLFSANYSVLIDLTDDPDSEGEAAISGKNLQTDSKTTPATPPPMKMNSRPFGNRPLGAKHPSRSVDSPGQEEIEIPESPTTIRASPVTTVGGHHNNGVSSKRPTAMATVPHIVPTDTEAKDQLDGHEQAQEEADSSRGNMHCSRQPDIPTSSSPFPVRDPGTFLEDQSVKTPQECRPGAHIASRAESPTRSFARPEGESCFNVGDIAFGHVKDHRETARRPEYLFVGKMWLGPDTGVPINLLRAYRKEITRGDRLATLRVRKRTAEEVDVVEMTGNSIWKKVKRASFWRNTVITTEPLSRAICIIH